MGNRERTHRAPGSLDILVVYASRKHPLRGTTDDHLRAFGRYSGQRCGYLNLGLQGAPGYVKQGQFDLVIFHTTFLAGRWFDERMRILWKRALPLRELEAVKVMLPQDDFLKTDTLDRFFGEFGVDHVFTAMPKAEWPTIYPNVDPERIHPTLTGYIDPGTVRRIGAIGEKTERDIDIGYRVWQVPPWLGRGGRLKTQIAEAVMQRSDRLGLRTDISTRDEDVFASDGWYKFLSRCRYTIGAEGGASIHDRDGSIRRRTEAFMRDHPGAPFEEVERSCFPGQDGRVSLYALSPRHLEACVTRTCQILVEGAYGGILKPGVHYLPVKRDFSNLDEVLEMTRDERLRERIVEAAYRDIVQSGKYSLPRFVERVLDDTMLKFEGDRGPGGPHRLFEKMARRDLATQHALTLATDAHRALASIKTALRI